MPTPALAVAQSLPYLNHLSESIRSHLRLAAVAADHGAGIVLFPELSLTGYGRHFTLRDALAPQHPMLTGLQSIATQRGIVLVAGAPLASASGLHIGAIAFRPHAEPQIYLKQHLHEGEDVAFVPGQPGKPLDLAGDRVGLAVCADIAHPTHPHAAALAGCSVYAAACLITETGYASDAALLRSYAVAHRMVVLMANFGGPIPPWSSAGRSAIWSDDGELLAIAPETGEAVVLADRTPQGWRATVIPFHR